MKYTFNLEPRDGWNSFDSISELENLLYESFTRKENGGNWHYLNFTSDTAIWEYIRDGDVTFYVGYKTASNNKVISEIVVNSSDTTNTETKELVDVVAALEAKYGMERKST